MADSNHMTQLDVLIEFNKYLRRTVQTNPQTYADVEAANRFAAESVKPTKESSQ